MVAAFWAAWRTFRFKDVEVHATEEPDLLFATARSSAETTWGAAYANTYVFRMRVREGLIAEHREYFNPQPVLTVFGERPTMDEAAADA